MCINPNCKVCNILEPATLKEHAYTHDPESACANSPYIEWTIPGTDARATFSVGHPVNEHHDEHYSICYWIVDSCTGTHCIFIEKNISIGDLIKLYRRATSYDNLIRDTIHKIHRSYDAYMDKVEPRTLDEICQEFSLEKKSVKEGIRILRDSFK